MISFVLYMIDYKELKNTSGNNYFVKIQRPFAKFEKNDTKHRPKNDNGIYLLDYCFTYRNND